MPLPKRGVLIIRVSDPKQEREGLSLDNQERSLREYTDDHSIRVVQEFRFQESADLKIRRRFQEVIAFVRKRPDVTCIVGYRVDRMTRNYHDHVLLDDLRLNAGKELHFVHDRLVITQSTVGRDIQEWDTKVYLAKQYLNRLKEDAVVSHQFKLSRGELPTKAPFGYQNTKEDNRSIVLPEEPFATAVRRMYSWYASGATSTNEVRRRVNEEFGLRLSRGNVDHILKNPFYYGEMLFKGNIYPHIYEPLITYAMYQQARLVREGFHKEPTKFAGLPFAYRGLIRCAECGCAITCERKVRKNGTYRYYHCTQYNGSHNAAWIREEDLTLQFQHIFDGLHIPADELSRIVVALRESESEMLSFAANLRADVKSEKDRLTNRRQILLDDRLDGIITKDDYTGKMKEIDAELRALRRKESGIESADRTYYANVSDLLDLCARASSNFAAANDEQRQALVKLVLQNCSLKDKTLLWELKKPFDTVFWHAKSESWGPLLDAFRHKTVDLEDIAERLHALLENLQGRPVALLDWN